VATGIRRTREDAIIISYQGDGDLAAIGMGGIIHAANRGENITVVFVNNAIYGMTGGQMAPTTLVGQKTKTTPMGRSFELEGNPIGMCELMNSLNAPVYIERVSLGDAGRTLKARKAIRKAIKNQIDKKGFSFVEVLSPCPINWGMQPTDARRWLMDNMEPVFPVKVFRDNSATAEPYHAPKIKPLTDAELFELLSVEDREPPKVAARATPLPDQFIKIAGFGGQGVLSAGVLAANCVIAEGLNATWIPSYGAEMRGGKANASVIASHDPIGAPVVAEPNVLIAMNKPSLLAFEPLMKPDGLLLYDSSLIDVKPKRKDIRVLPIPASDIANEIGLVATATVIMLAVYATATGAFSVDTLRWAIPLSLKRKELADINLKAIDAGVAYYKKTFAK
ncbi:MAG: 2-oxoacid:acceptor oxidoreductase family protein, partial [Planctomycetota bacterium]